MDDETHTDAGIDLERSLLPLARKTLAGDVRDFLLEQQVQEHHVMPWNLRDEIEQGKAIRRCEDIAHQLVARMLNLVASQANPVVAATLKQATLDDKGIKLTLMASAVDPNRHILYDLVNDQVVIVLLDKASFMGDRGRPKPVPDQSALFPEETSEAPDEPAAEQTDTDEAFPDPDGEAGMQPPDERPPGHDDPDENTDDPERLRDQEDDVPKKGRKPRRPQA